LSHSRFLYLAYCTFVKTTFQADVGHLDTPGNEN
jgi:hypothetical protein